jgi:hypothetical protein
MAIHPLGSNQVVDSERYDVSARVELKGLSVAAFTPKLQQGFKRAMSVEFKVCTNSGVITHIV